MGKLALRCFTYFSALILLLLVPCVTQADESPQSIGFWCAPEMESITDGAYYLPREDPCIYYSPGISGSGFKVGDIYLGTIGSSTRISGRNLSSGASDTVSPQVSTFSLKNIQPGDELFVAIYLVRSNPLFFDSQKFISFFTTGTPPPSNDYGFIRFVYGEPPPTCIENCFSNVLFIPGIKATELYEGDAKRWLPGLFNFDGSHLAMDASGESVNEITVGTPLGNAYGVFEIYNSFLNFLNNLKSTDVVTNWQSAPYDWRYDVYNAAIRDQHIYGGSMRSLVDQIHKLAATSKTGKVTIIAHSNGGLVGKALIDGLGEDRELVDRFVMVGTPQLGTPSAIAAMLHGSGQELPLDLAPFAMSKATARELSENMPGVYGLLPLLGYFDAVSDPIIMFDNSSYSAPFRNAYGESIDSAGELYSFLLGTDDGRAKPNSGDTLTPTILNNELLSGARATRNALELWTPPEGVEVIQIAGWGLDTMRGLAYDARNCSLPQPCSTFLDIEPLITVEGDQTVMSPSATAMNVETYYFNMAAFNRDTDSSWSHANMLAATSVQELLKNIITAGPRDAPYVTTTKPIAGEVGTRLHASVHSPITIGVLDQKGRFTGVVPNPDSVSDVPVLVQRVPNTYYLEVGEGKYVGLEADKGYDIVMHGIGSGSFSLELEKVEGDQISKILTYSNIPVSPETNATLHTQDVETVGALEIDENGDGVLDVVFFDDDSLLPLDRLVEYLRARMEYIDDQKVREKLVKGIDKLTKKELSAKELLKLGQRIGKDVRNEAMDTVSAEELLNLIEQIENAL